METRLTAEKDLVNIKQQKSFRIPGNISTDIATIVYQMCIQPDPYNYQVEVYNAIETLLSDLVKPFYEEVIKTDDVHFLTQYCLFYCVAKNLHRAVRIGFGYLNRFFVRNSPNYGPQLATVEQKASHLLEDIFQTEEMFERIKNLCKKADFEILESIWYICHYEWSFTFKQKRTLLRLCMTSTLKTCHRSMRILGPVILEFLEDASEEEEDHEKNTIIWTALPREL